MCKSSAKQFTQADIAAKVAKRFHYKNYFNMLEAVNVLMGPDCHSCDAFIGPFPCLQFYVNWVTCYPLTSLR
jgi:hypothetical protein